MAQSRKPFRDGKVHVCQVKCPTCIFRPGNLMQLAPGRVKGMVDDCITGQGAIPCHDTLDGKQAICRGFFDLYKDQVQGLQIAERLELITYVEARNEK